MEKIELFISLYRKAIRDEPDSIWLLKDFVNNQMATNADEWERLFAQHRTRISKLIRTGSSREAACLVPYFVEKPKSVVFKDFAVVIHPTPYLVEQILNYPRDKVARLIEALLHEKVDVYYEACLLFNHLSNKCRAMVIRKLARDSELARMFRWLPERKRFTVDEDLLRLTGITPFIRMKDVVFAFSFSPQAINLLIKKLFPLLNDPRTEFIKIHLKDEIEKGSMPAVCSPVDSLNP